MAHSDTEDNNDYLASDGPNPQSALLGREVALKAENERLRAERAACVCCQARDQHEGEDSPDDVPLVRKRQRLNRR